jgi:transposase
MHVHGYDTRRWRHLDTCQFKTVLESRVPRVKCPQHGTQTVSVPWAEPYGRFTSMFEAFALLLMKSCDISAAARHLRISWGEADHIKERGVRRGLARKKPVPAKAVCVDEKSVGRGHDYVTVVTRVPEEGKAFVDHIADGRTQASIDSYWRLPGTGDLGKIRCASMDMWEAYVNSAMENLPDGAATVTHDPFHLVQTVNRALEKVRRQEQPLLAPDARREMKGARFAWLYGFENLPPKWAQRLEALKAGKTQTALAWRLKEQFRSFYECADSTQAFAYFHDWFNCVIESGLKPMIDVAESMIRHLPQILNYFVHKITNSFSEGINSIIQKLISRARGYRNRERLKRDIYFHMGNLDMLPVVS